MREKIKTLVMLCLRHGVPFMIDAEYFSLVEEPSTLACLQLGYDNVFYSKGLKRDLKKVDELIEFVENSDFDESFDFKELPEYIYSIKWEALWTGESHYTFFGKYGKIDEARGLI